MAELLEDDHEVDGVGDVGETERVQVASARSEEVVQDRGERAVCSGDSANLIVAAPGVVRR